MPKRKRRTVNVEPQHLTDRQRLGIDPVPGSRDYHVAKLQEAVDEFRMDLRAALPQWLKWLTKRKPEPPRTK